MLTVTNETLKHLLNYRVKISFKNNQRIIFVSCYQTKLWFNVDARVLFPLLNFPFKVFIMSSELQSRCCNCDIFYGNKCILIIIMDSVFQMIELLPFLLCQRMCNTYFPLHMKHIYLHLEHPSHVLETIFTLDEIR